MKIRLIQIGKTHFDFVDQGFDKFNSRLKHYCRFDSTVIELTGKQKSAEPETVKKNEAALLLKHLNPGEYVVLLDENGKEYTSTQFAEYLRKTFNHHASLVFVIGGAYGFSKDVYDRADALVSMSKMTFSHQMIRLIFAEQLYRSMTILKGEPYHHE